MPKSSRSTQRKVTIACEVCTERNYRTHKSLQKSDERLIMKKYCPKCDMHTTHKETK